MTRSRIVSVAAALTVAAGVPAGAADSPAGKHAFDSVCAECHELKDYAGKSAADIEKSLQAIMAKQKKHKKKLSLTDADIENIAAYLATAKAN